MPYPQRWAYQLSSRLYRWRQNRRLTGCRQAATANFTYLYPDSVSPESLRLIQEESEKIFPLVNRFFCYQPLEAIPVVIHPSAEALNQCFGWSGDRGPMGVYWLGYLNILAPEAWIDGDAPAQKQIFKTLGPMAHEYSHYVIDRQTWGNYPRWFSEGLAQYTESALDYFTIQPPRPAVTTPYPFEELVDTFDHQPDQPLAYWQSLLAVRLLAQEHGFSTLRLILQRLGQGKSFEPTLRRLTGHTHATLTAAVSQLLTPPGRCSAYQ